VYLQTCSITASKVTRSWPPSASTHSLDHCLQVHLETLSITPSNCISKLVQSQPSSVSLNPPDYGLQVDLHSCLITASNCISKLTQSRAPSESTNSLDHGLQSASPNSLDHSLQSASPHSLDHGPGVYPSVHPIVIFRRTLNCSQAPPAASPDIPCVDGSLYRYIDTSIGIQTEYNR
jgi:hypothetical protein